LQHISTETTSAFKAEASLPRLQAEVELFESDVRISTPSPFATIAEKFFDAH
jgi:hypothetical protein